VIKCFVVERRGVMSDEIVNSKQRFVIVAIFN
jgi:hypothetical protein